MTKSATSPVENKVQAEIKSDLVFGIDLGIASCGWAVLDYRNGLKQPPKIAGIGTWCFRKPEDPKTKASLTKARRDARLVRRTLRRRRERMNKIRTLFHRYNLIPDAQSDVLQRVGLELRKHHGNQKDIEGNPWTLRGAALERLLTPPELAIALAHIAKHRGFQSNAKDPLKVATLASKDTEESDDKTDRSLSKEKDDERLKGKMIALDRQFKKSQYKTWGAFVAQSDAFNKNFGQKRNREGNFLQTPLRDELKAEVKAIFDAQRELAKQNNTETYATADLQSAYTNIAFHQRPLQDSFRLLGECTLDTEEKRACVQAPSFELFRLLSKLTLIRLTSPDGETIPKADRHRVIPRLIRNNDERFRLTREQIKEIILHLLANGASSGENSDAKLSYKDLRKILKLDEKVQFLNFPGEWSWNTPKLGNGEEQTIKPTPYEWADEQRKKQAEAPAKDKKLRISKDYPENLKTQVPAKPFSGTGTLCKVLGQDLFDKLFNIDALLSDTNHLRALDECAHFLSFYGDPQKIKAGLNKTDFPKLSEAEKQDLISRLITGFNNGDFSHFNKTARISTKAARKLLPHLADGYSYGGKETEDGKITGACQLAGYAHSDNPFTRLGHVKDSDGLRKLCGLVSKQINNPVAKHAIHEGLKQLWCLKNNFGLPGRIVIELSRDMGKSGEERNKEERENQKREKNRDNLKKEIAKDKDCPITENKITHSHLIRYLLAKSQNKRCIYCDEKSLANPFNDKDSQVDHILPLSRTMDDSFRNKVLACTKCNEDKENRTPYEWFKQDKTPEAWRTFTKRVEGLFPEFNPEDDKEKVLIPRKRKNLLLEDLSAEIADKLISRNLNDGRYATKILAQAAATLYPEGHRAHKGEARHVYTRAGQITSLLRRAWGVHASKKQANGKRIPDNRHHALDALICAATSESQNARITMTNRGEQSDMRHELHQTERYGKIQDAETDRGRKQRRLAELNENGPKDEREAREHENLPRAIADLDKKIEKLHQDIHDAEQNHRGAKLKIAETKRDDKQRRLLDAALDSEVQKELRREVDYLDRNIKNLRDAMAGAEKLKGSEKLFIQTEKTKHPEYWPNFRQDCLRELGRITTARSEIRRARGSAHEDTTRSVEPGKPMPEKKLKELTKELATKKRSLKARKTGQDESSENCAKLQNEIKNLQGVIASAEDTLYTRTSVMELINQAIKKEAKNSKISMATLIDQTIESIKENVAHPSIRPIIAEWLKQGIETEKTNKKNKKDFKAAWNNKSQELAPQKADWLKKLEDKCNRLNLTKTQTKKVNDRADKRFTACQREKLQKSYPTKVIEYPSFKDKNGDTHFIRKVTLATKGKTYLPLARGGKDHLVGVVKQDGIVRTDVFSKKAAKGKFQGQKQFYLVPIYRWQVANQKQFPLPPNKAVISGKNEEDWLKLDATYQFEFSLYPDSYIKIRRGETIVQGYYNGIARSTASISIALPNHAEPKFQKGVKDTSVSGLITSIGAKSLQAFEKYTIDRLGKLHRVKNEPRMWHRRDVTELYPTQTPNTDA